MEQIVDVGCLVVAACAFIIFSIALKCSSELCENMRFASVICCVMGVSAPFFFYRVRTVARLHGIR